MLRQDAMQFRAWAGLWSSEIQLLRLRSVQRVKQHNVRILAPFTEHRRNSLASRARRALQRIQLASLGASKFD